MIKENLIKLNTEIPKNVELIAVSKTKPASSILEAYEVGQRKFGENKVQELTEKYNLLPKDIEWHLIGHLQSNKVKYIAPFVHLIHAVDSLKLLVEIDKQAQKHKRIIYCLLQFHIAQEETKYGLDLSEAESLLLSKEYASLKNISISGVMGMASFTNNTTQIRNEFHSLKEIFTTLKGKYFKNQDSFSILSMGMSGDYQIAIEEGSNMVRLGSSIFGLR
jgi:pyridoxal phosphate enzyme (YggS family)